MLENLRTWGKWYLTFFYLRQSFLLQGNNTIYKFVFLANSAREKAKVTEHRTDLGYNVINELF